MQNITTPQCDNCPKKTEHHPTHRTTVLPTDQTTQGPSPPPKPVEYIVVGASGVCLRIKAIFIIMLNITEIRNITIPPPPITKVWGMCYYNITWLDLEFPGGKLIPIFRKNKTNHVFYLEEIYISIREKDRNGFISVDSCHHKSRLSSVPRSQFLRLRRNCTDLDTFKAQAEILKQRFLDKGYDITVLDGEVQRVVNTSRESLAAVKPQQEPDDTYK
ncbi:uncharacterized protein LOC143962429 [Lithobates pipiens]